MGSFFCPRCQRSVDLIWPALNRRYPARPLLAGETRFNRCRHSILRLSDRLLSERLKELEEENVVVRIVYPETPVRIEYRLTEKVRILGRVVEAIGAWAYRWTIPAYEKTTAIP